MKTMKTTEVGQDTDSISYRNARPSVSANRVKTGFTLIEIMITVAIISILAMVAYPSYQSYLIKNKRVEMMHQMQTVASDIETQKFSLGNYKLIPLTNINRGYPNNTDPIYNLVATPNPLTHNWLITATPLATRSNKDDGVLTLNAQGVRCRIINADRRCGIEDEWNE